MVNGEIFDEQNKAKPIQELNLEPGGTFNKFFRDLKKI